MFIQMEDRMMLRKAEGEDRSWSDSNGVCVYYIIFQLDRITSNWDAFQLAADVWLFNIKCFS